MAGTVTPPTCASGPTTALSISEASGGSGTLQWGIFNVSTNVQVGSTTSISNSISVSAGNYYARVTDFNHPTCSAITANFTVNSPVTGAISQSAVINCAGQSTAGLTLTPSGGTSSYTYQWYKNNVTISAASGGTAKDLSNIGAGDYKVIITDGNSCTYTTPVFTVTQPSQLTAPVLPSSHNGYSITCKGANDGSIDLTPTGGTSPYGTFQWYKNSVAIPGGTTEDISGQGPGDYYVTCKDAKGCSATSATTTLTEPPTSVSASLTGKSDVTCFGFSDGSITVSASGGTGSI